MFNPKLSLNDLAQYFSTLTKMHSYGYRVRLRFSEKLLCPPFFVVVSSQAPNPEGTKQGKTTLTLIRVWQSLHTSLLTIEILQGAILHQQDQSCRKFFPLKPLSNPNKFLKMRNWKTVMYNCRVRYAKQARKMLDSRTQSCSFIVFSVLQNCPIQKTQNGQKSGRQKNPFCEE